MRYLKSLYSGQGKTDIRRIIGSLLNGRSPRIWSYCQKLVTQVSGGAFG